jgi:hypothetical protein
MLEAFIKAIDQEQTQANKKIFADGLLPSYRRNDVIGYTRPDNNIFFTASTIFILQKIKDLLPQKSQEIVSAIIQKGIALYPSYQNKNGLKTYNFFPTKPPVPFGNGCFLHRFKYFEIPDDIDDTALVYLTKPHSPADVQWLQQKLASHANLSQQNIVNTFDEYKGLSAYNTWFGQRMYGEFDACAICNMLYCVLSYGLELDTHAQASLRYLSDIVLSNRYRTQPFRVAHHYVRVVPVMYHLCRLIETFDVLPECRVKVKEDLFEMLQDDTWQGMDRVVLENSWMRLTGLLPSHSTDFDIQTANDNSFYFFIAGFMTAFENPLYHIAHWPVFHFRWRCRAFNLALLAENTALKQQYVLT